MFCPQCGTNQNEELKFCNLCGANLQAVRQAVATRETATGEKFDWSKTWVAEMFLSEAERKRRQQELKIVEQELESQSGIALEVKRYNEVKAGVITACAGIGVAIFLFALMRGIILSGQNPPHDEPILNVIWVAGVIPILVGIALIINGLFVSKKIVEVTRREMQRKTPPQGALGVNTMPRSLNSADTSEIPPASFSVTEDTTKHLSNSRPKQ
jgi:hypothetical protein